MDDLLPIVLTCDDGYVKYASVVIASIIKNRNRNLQYNIWIVSDSISDENRVKILSQAKGIGNITIKFYMLENLDFEKFYLNSYMSASTYYRFYLSSIFTQYDRILYLDSDLIVDSDISEYAGIDFEDKLAICSRSPYIYNIIKQNGNPEYPLSYFTDMLKMPQPEDYFNAGVMLYNLKKMRELNIQEKLFAALGEIKEPKLQDQDILNSVFSRNGGVKIISQSFNYTGQIKITPNRLLLNVLLKKIKSKNQWFTIYHYVGKVKPWQNDDVDSGLFFQYAFQSPFFDEIISQNKLSGKNIISKYRLPLLDLLS